MSNTTTCRIDQIANVMVPVTDADAAIAFYTEKLGFELHADVPFGNGDRWIEVGPPGAVTHIALVPSGRDTLAGTNSRIALTTGDLDALHSELRDRGVDVDAEVSRMGDPVPPMFWFRDNEGNTHLAVQSA